MRIRSGIVRRIVAAVVGSVVVVSAVGPRPARAASDGRPSWADPELFDLARIAISAERRAQRSEGWGVLALAGGVFSLVGMLATVPLPSLSVALGVAGFGLLGVSAHSFDNRNAHVAEAAAAQTELLHGLRALLGNEEAIRAYGRYRRAAAKALDEGSNVGRTDETRPPVPAAATVVPRTSAGGGHAR